MTLAEILRKGYLNWIAERGCYGTQAEFALELGVSPVAFNRHYNGRTVPNPGDPVIDKYAAYFGDVIYDALGLARKDERFLEFQKRYDTTPEGQKDRLLEIIDEFLLSIGAKPLD